MAGWADRWRRRRTEMGDAEHGAKGAQGLSMAAIVGGAVVLLGVLFALLIILGARPVAAQGLADFDYENLSFRGVAMDVGYIIPSRVESTTSFGVRADLGFLGPGVRITTGLSRWSSFLTREEVGRLESQLERLIEDQREGEGEPISVDLGRISWSDVALSTDAHVIWQVPFGVLTYTGLGATAHVLRGGGAAIEDTFVEDLLDSVRAGINAHAGLELPVHRRLRLLGEVRYELLENLSYVQLRAGGQIMFGAWAGGPRR